MAEAADQVPVRGFLVQEKEENLFSCPATDSMAHCISADLRMGKGIAVAFKNKFKGLDELEKQRKGVGDVAVLKREERYVYYLITKEWGSQKPTIDSLRSSLEAMRAHCLENGVSRIAMPRIGCGLDRLKWEEVLQVLNEVFKETNVVITVYNYKYESKAKKK